jgi:hypothetical protein
MGPASDACAYRQVWHSVLMDVCSVTYLSIVAERTGRGRRPWAWVAYGEDGAYIAHSEAMFTSRDAALRVGRQVVSWAVGFRLPQTSKALH